MGINDQLRYNNQKLNESIFLVTENNKVLNELVNSTPKPSDSFDTNALIKNYESIKE